MNDLDKLIISYDRLSTILVNPSIAESSSKLITFANPYSYYLLKDYRLLKEIDAIFVDGALLARLHKWVFKLEQFERASFDFSSIADEVFEHTIRYGLKIAFIGGTDKDINKTVRQISEKYPKLSISYHSNGYLLDNEAVKDMITHAGKCDVIVFGLGTILQEEMGLRLKRNFPSEKLIFTCGGFLTQTAVRADYYYPTIKFLGLRWLQRAVDDKNVRKRLAIDYPKFIYKYLREKM